MIQPETTLALMSNVGAVAAVIGQDQGSLVLMAIGLWVWFLGIWMIGVIGDD
jgi:hypothetical protein